MNFNKNGKQWLLFPVNKQEFMLVKPSGVIRHT